MPESRIATPMPLPVGLDEVRPRVSRRMSGPDAPETVAPNAETGALMETDWMAWSAAIASNCAGEVALAVLGKYSCNLLQARSLALESRLHRLRQETRSLS